MRSCHAVQERKTQARKSFTGSYRILAFNPQAGDRAIP